MQWLALLLGLRECVCQAICNLYASITELASLCVKRVMNSRLDKEAIDLPSRIVNVKAVLGFHVLPGE